MKLNILTIITLGACLALAGCPSNNQVVLPPPGTTPLAHVYVGQNLFGGSPYMAVFGLPITNASTPSALVPAIVGARATSLAFDSAGNLYSASFSDGKVYVFTPPITSSSTPSFSFAADHAEGVVFDSTGRLFVSDDSTGQIFVFTPPFSSSSTPAFTMTGALNPRQGVFDSSGNFIVSNCSGGLAVFNPPFSNAQTPAFTLAVAGAICVSGVAIDPVTHNLFTGDLDVSRIVVFTLPLSSSSTPSLTISDTSASHFWSLAFDANENLYGAGFGGSDLAMFSPPYSASMSPTVDIALGYSPSGLALGP